MARELALPASGGPLLVPLELLPQSLVWLLFCWCWMLLVAVFTAAYASAFSSLCWLGPRPRIIVFPCPCIQASSPLSWFLLSFLLLFLFSFPLSLFPHCHYCRSQLSSSSSAFLLFPSSLYLFALALALSFSGSAFSSPCCLHRCGGHRC